MIIENPGTILTLLVLLIITAAIIFKMHRDKKKHHCAGCSKRCVIKKN